MTSTTRLYQNLKKFRNLNLFSGFKICMKFKRGPKLQLMNTIACRVHKTAPRCLLSKSETTWSPLEFVEVYPDSPIDIMSAQRTRHHCRRTRHATSCQLEILTYSNNIWTDLPWLYVVDLLNGIHLHIICISKHYGRVLPVYVQLSNSDCLSSVT